MPTFRIKAQFRLLSTDKGGRTNPISTHYRPDWNLGHSQDGIPMLNGGQLDFVGDLAKIHPGDTGTVEINPLTPDFWKHIAAGDVIPAYEGPKLVGYATIDSVVLDPDEGDVAEAVRHMLALAPAKKTPIPPLVVRTLDQIIRVETPTTPKMVFFLVPDISVEEFAAAVRSDEEDVPNVDLTMESYVRMQSLPKELQNEVRKALGIWSQK